MDEGFVSYLISKKVCDKTIQAYCIYLKKMEFTLEELGTNLNQDILNGFLSIYSHGVARAFVKNYLKYKKINDLEIPDITGRKEKKQIIIIPKYHIEMFRNYFYDKRVDLGLMFDLTYYGALRREEVIGITMADFNLSELRSTDVTTVKLLIRGKGKRERVVILPKLLLKAILIYIDSKAIGKYDRIFKISNKRWWALFHKACLDLGFIKISKGKIVALYHPHSLRHTKSTEWFDEGLDIVSIQRRLGHSSISTTQIYINPDEKKEQNTWANEYER